jgi:hypothetical protein
MYFKVEKDPDYKDKGFLIIECGKESLFLWISSGDENLANGICKVLNAHEAVHAAKIELLEKIISSQKTHIEILNNFIDKI